MLIDAATLSGRAAYQLLTDTIVPRPIAWVTTISAAGIPNLAPFSFFTGVTGRPPTLVLSIVSKARRGPEGVVLGEKHTLRNLRETGVMIVHGAPVSLRESVERSGEDLPEDPDELSKLGFGDVVPGTWVAVPRLAALPIAMECRLDRLVPVGDPPAHLVLAEVLGWHVDDALAQEGRVLSRPWGPLHRLGIEGFGG